MVGFEARGLLDEGCFKGACAEPVATRMDANNSPAPTRAQAVIRMIGHGERA